ncbi:MAG: metal-dependent hydrolase [Paracoccaceae bacterium]
MLTAHLPSGYILGRTWPRHVPALMPVALLGAVIPDFDMFWFHVVDDGAIHHHRYWVHIPVFWLAVAAAALPVAWWLGVVRTAVVFFAAVFMHLVLDTISGGIMWGAPVSGHLFALVEVPANYSHWVISFMLHWTFLAELVVWIVAATLWFRRGALA